MIDGQIIRGISEFRNRDKGRIGVIFASGPSLADFPLDPIINGYVTIAVNEEILSEYFDPHGLYPTYAMMPHPRLIVRRFYTGKFNPARTYHLTQHLQYQLQGFYAFEIVPNKLVTSWDKNPNALGCSGISLFQCLNLALMIGLKKCYIIGADFGPIDGRWRYHEKGQREYENEEYYDKHLQDTVAVIRDIEAVSDLRFVNLSSRGRLSGMIDTESCLQHRRRGG